MGFRTHIELIGGVALATGACAVLGVWAVTTHRGSSPEELAAVEAESVALLESFGPAGRDLLRGGEPFDVTSASVVSWLEALAAVPSLGLRFVGLVDASGQVVGQSGGEPSAHAVEFVRLASHAATAVVRTVAHSGRPVAVQVSRPIFASTPLDPLDRPDSAAPERLGTLVLERDVALGSVAGRHRQGPIGWLRDQGVRVWILWVMGIVVTMATLRWLIAGVVRRPLQRLGDVVRSYARGELHKPVPRRLPREFLEIADLVHQLAHNDARRLENVSQECVNRTEQLEMMNHQLRVANQQLEQLARTDSLTGLCNRRHLMERLDFESRRGRRNYREFAIVMIDIDHFKVYNDNNGHGLGDELLVRIAEIMRTCLRETDTLARFGGEEFIVLLLDTSAVEGERVAQKLCQAVAAHRFRNGHTQPGQRVTISAGVASYPTDGRDPRMLLEAADQALYVSKATGRNRVTRYGTAMRTEMASGA